MFVAGNLKPRLFCTVACLFTSLTVAKSQNFDFDSDSGAIILHADDYDNSDEEVQAFWNQSKSNRLASHASVANPIAKSVTIVGNGPPELKGIMDEWMQQYQDYRAGYADIYFDPEISYPGNVSLENLTDAYAALNGTQNKNLTVSLGANASADANPFYLNGNFLNYVVSPFSWTAQERLDYPDLVQLPTLVSAIVICFNLAGVSELRLKAEQIVGIFNGTYLRWTDDTFAGTPWHQSGTTTTMNTITTSTILLDPGARTSSISFDIEVTTSTISLDSEATTSTNSLEPGDPLLRNRRDDPDPGSAADPGTAAPDDSDATPAAPVAIPADPADPDVSSDPTTVDPALATADPASSDETTSDPGDAGSDTTSADPIAPMDPAAGGSAGAGQSDTPPPAELRADMSAFNNLDAVLPVPIYPNAPPDYPDIIPDVISDPPRDPTQILIRVPAGPSLVTRVLTTYLSGISPEWNATYGIFSSGWALRLPSRIRFREERTVIQVMGALMSPNYYGLAIGTIKDAFDHGIPCAKIQSRPNATTFTAPSPYSIGLAMGTFVRSFDLDTLDVDFAKVASEVSYPMTHVYQIVIKNGGQLLGKPIDCANTTDLLRFFRFAYVDTQLRNRYVQDGYLQPFRAIVYSAIRRKWKQMKCGLGNRQNVWELVKSDIRRDMSQQILSPLPATIDLFVTFIMLIIMAYIGYKFVYFYKIAQDVRKAVYRIPSHAVTLVSKQNALTDRFKGVVASRRVLDYHTPKAYVHTMYFGRWKAYEVMLRPCSLNIHRMSQTMKWALVEMIHLSKHPHIATFYGISEVKNGRYFVSNFCPYGDLRSMMIAKEHLFTLNMKYSLSCDIADGMEFLHSKGILHGNLRSCAIYIEANFSAKVGDWEYTKLHRLQGTYFAQETRLAQTLSLFEQTAFYPWLYWTAPEVLQSGMLGAAVVPSKGQDVYSFGIILGEIFGDDAAYQRYQDAPYNFTPTEILTKILSGNLRPRMLPGNDAPLSVHRLMDHCWAFSPKQRPTFKTVKNVLVQVSSFRKPISDLIVIESQILADKLKNKAKRMEERYERVRKEFHRFSRVLVPYPIWRRIYLSHVRPPLCHYEEAVILRCTLTNFDALLAAQSAQITIETLNLMHRVFDEMVEKNGRIYRLFWNGATVTAIGGAPFGLELDPVHSVAQISLDYMLWAHSSRAPTLPPLSVRFGIHSGPVAAGCVDYTASHYVMLGELMKTVFIIETSSQPYRVLISEEFHNQLRKLAKVYVKYRVMEASHVLRWYDKKTYWLIGSNYYDQQYLLDDVLYGKDELDEPWDGFVNYGQEKGIATDCHTARIVPVDGKSVAGSGTPAALDTAAIVRGLKKRKAAIMKVPPPHVLQAQVLRAGTGQRRFWTQQQMVNETKGHHIEDETQEGQLASPADVLVGIYHRTPAQEEEEEEEEGVVNTEKHEMKPQTMAELATIKPREFTKADIKLKPTMFAPKRSSHSMLLPTPSVAQSAASGEGRLNQNLQLNVLEASMFGGILELEGSNKKIAQLENIPPRPHVFKADRKKVPKVAHSGEWEEYPVNNDRKNPENVILAREVPGEEDKETGDDQKDDDQELVENTSAFTEDDRPRAFSNTQVLVEPATETVQPVTQRSSEGVVAYAEPYGDDYSESSRSVDEESSADDALRSGTVNASKSSITEISKSSAVKAPKSVVANVVKPSMVEVELTPIETKPVKSKLSTTAQVSEVDIYPDPPHMVTSQLTTSGLTMSPSSVIKKSPDADRTRTPNLDSLESNVKVIPDKELHPLLRHFSNEDSSQSSGSESSSESSEDHEEMVTKML